MVFEVGRHYTREEIHGQVGGSVQSYLPMVDNRVVAACLRLDTNPGAPDVVLPGKGPLIESSAERFATDGNTVPTFLKDDVNRWRYVGMYRAKRRSLDVPEIEVHAQRAGRTGQVSQVLYLERTDGGQS